MSSTSPIDPKYGSPPSILKNPWQGRSALDAVLLMFHAMDMMREHSAIFCESEFFLDNMTTVMYIVNDRCHDKGR